MESKTLHFLSQLAENNNREWFQQNRKDYDAAKADLEKLVAYLIEEVGKFQDLGNLQVKECIFRINRDIRFSKNKAPYKNNLSAGIGPGGKGSGKIDYYLQIQPGDRTFLGGGMWETTPEQLARFRQEIDYNADELKQIIHDKDFHAYYPKIEGEALKTTPKGYAKDHPEIELLKQKQLFFSHNYTDKEVTSKDFGKMVVQGISLLKPFTDYMNYVIYEQPAES
ncbi:DUF2461 domain-containing protein [Dyadobacter fanqingshengii]|uniref:DUF2461 domain-containing protein n=1 Tax=Dyadobacter fanqingshengii TaxID=2906443 RepID=A0A9X1P9Y5_9BACT|nr:DUF2461 domain-containing protein [Dyadobacter fanqingshengii]MCF0040712.1 DUF2461 domain-containing protein [Dyadobacter fanqingshengii]MCF2506179.1 DUF2461 domain-containing protein [Dyadobacter fanqingshengii]USJ37551.1 DUF2461 domain-containing protein [Dyadobacter fanqingshengii]